MPDAKIYREGVAEVARMPDCMIDIFTPERLLPHWRAGVETVPDEVWAAATAPDGEHVLLSVHTWVVRDRGRTILIDTGAGNDKPRPYAPYFRQLHTPFLDRLAAIGVRG